MKMVDVGHSYGAELATAPPKNEKFYPSLRLDVDDLPGLGEVGDEVTLVIKCKVKSMRDDEQGLSVEVEVRKCGVAEKETKKNSADEELEKLTGRK